MVSPVTIDASERIALPKNQPPLLAELALLVLPRELAAVLFTAIKPSPALAASLLRGDWLLRLPPEEPRWPPGFYGEPVVRRHAGRGR